MRVKKWRFCYAAISLFLTLFLCYFGIGGYAVSQEDGAEINCSDWAYDSLVESRALGFGPTEEELWTRDMAAPMNRCMFFRHVMRFVAVQQGCGTDALVMIACHYNTEKSELGVPLDPFPEEAAGGETNALYHLGIVKGRGDGTLDLAAEITRQEACAVLVRTYRLYGRELPECEGQSDFTDFAQIGVWAVKDVCALTGAGIIKGYEDGCFGPNDPITTEQCLMMLLRMDKELPVSRRQGNVPALYTYEQYMQVLREREEAEGYSLVATQLVEGPVATFVRMEEQGVPRAKVYLYLVYRSGRIRTLGGMGTCMGVCQTGNGTVTFGLETQEPHFSLDGGTFYCTIPLKKEIPDPIKRPSALHGHEAGIYQVTVDVETGQAQVARQK